MVLSFGGQFKRFDGKGWPKVFKEARVTRSSDEGSDQAKDQASAGPSSVYDRISLQQIAVTLFCSDAAAIVLFGTVGNIAPLPAEEVIDLSRPQIALFALGLFWIIAQSFRVYSSRRMNHLRPLLVRQVAAVNFLYLSLISIGAATKTTQVFSRVWFFSWMVMVLVSTVLTRIILFAQISRRLRHGASFHRALSVGVFAEPMIASDIRAFSGNRSDCVETISYTNFDQLTLLADSVLRLDIDQIFVSTKWEDAPEAVLRLEKLRHLAAEIYILPDDRRLSGKLSQVTLDGSRIKLRTMDKPIGEWSIWLKRTFDIVIAVSVLVVLSPLFVVVAAAVAMTSPGPILFRQSRQGFNGRVFELWKFRSMNVGESDPGASVQTSKSDVRVTRVGRFIRKTSIDELPQLVNVLQGSMSIVGPRPHALQMTTVGRSLEDIVDYYAARHRVLPGLTGLAQVNGVRGELDTLEKVRRRVDYDIAYIETWSLWLDLKIIAKTARLMFHDPHAY